MILNQPKQPPKLVVDVLAPIRSILVAAKLQVAYSDAGRTGKQGCGSPTVTADRIHAGVMHSRKDNCAEILLTKTGMESTIQSELATDYVRLACIGPATPDGMRVASRLRDDAVGVLRGVNRVEIDGKMIHGIGIGEDRSEQDTETERPMVEIELTVFSDLRRY